MADNHGRAEEKMLHLQVAEGLLECPICMKTLKEPIVTPCGHWFCAKCIRQCLRLYPGQCPFCRCEVWAEALNPDRLMTTIASNLGVRCGNHQGGCHWIGPSSSKARHEEVCLVSHLLAWQHQAERFEVAKREAEEEVCALRAQLEDKAKAILDFECEVNALKLQAEADIITIASLKQGLQKLEHEVTGKDAVLAALQLPLTPVIVDVGVQCQLAQAEQKSQNKDRLLIAAESGDNNIVTQILDQEDGDNDVDINAVNSVDGRSALHLAVLFGHCVIAKMLLTSDRFIAENVRDKEENTALHLACLHGREDLVDMLLSSPRFKGVSLQNCRGHTALHCTALQGNGKEARMLLNAERFSDVAVNAIAEEDLMIYESVAKTKGRVLEDGFTALHLAAKFGRVAVVDALLESPRFQSVNAMTSHRRFTALYIASLAGSVGVVQALLRSPRFALVDALDGLDRSVLYVAAEHGKAEVVRYLLQASRFTVVDQPSRRYGSTALSAAAGHGHAEASRVLLEMDRFPASVVNIVNKHGLTPLHDAVASGSVATVELFLESAKVAVNRLDASGSSALHIAAFRGHVDIVELLLVHRRFTAATAGLVNKSGNSALHLAALQGHLAVARALLRAERFPDHAVNAMTSGEGASALHVAIQFGHFSVVELMLASPRFLAANSRTNGDGHTALHLAAAQGDVKILKALLESKRFSSDSVNALDASGCTALHIMAERGRRGAAEALRASGKFKMLSARCNKGRRALDIAYAKGQTDMTNLVGMWDRELTGAYDWRVNFAPSAAWRM